MRRFVDAVRSAVAEESWYGALAMALTLPDICSKLEEPDARGSRARYVRWYDEYLRPTYTARVGPERREHVFLSGADCYALRCSYLHEGSAEIGLQRAREALDRFHSLRHVRAGSFTAIKVTPPFSYRWTFSAKTSAARLRSGWMM